MRHFFLLLAIVVIAPFGMFAQNESAPQKKMGAERKFQILVKVEDSPSMIESNNEKIEQLASEKQGAQKDRGLLFDLIKTGFGSSLTQKTVNATSNVLSLGVNYLINAFKGHREEWYNNAVQECTFKKSLISETKIDDFYAFPSTRGALDPRDIKFKGIGCRNYLETPDKEGYGREVFFVFCNMKRDVEGIKRIVNHSKFELEIDSLAFDPEFCCLPYDSTGTSESRFDFNKRSDLTLTIKARIYSSWINDAIEVTTDKQLGEFTITAKICKEMLNSDGMFIYDKNNEKHKELVSVVGDCFIVPRSFTGTLDGNDYKVAWGTGQYRVEMDVMETCKINDEYYLVKEVGKGKQVNESGLPGKKKWDKAKWGVEWKEMKSRKKKDSFWKSAWNGIVLAYQGDSWVQTFTDPITTSIYEYETQKLTQLLIRE